MKERYLLPIDEEEPKYFFARKLNSTSNVELTEWIRKNHLELTPFSPCSVEHLLTRPNCLTQFLDEIALPTYRRLPTFVNSKLINDDKSVILIPTNTAVHSLTDNLECSLLKLGITNIVYWSLDPYTHQKLIEMGKISLFFAGEHYSSKRMSYHSTDLTKIMRLKPILLRKIIEAGFDVWYLDSDTVVLKDFRKSLVLYDTSHPTILMGIDDMQLVQENKIDVAESDEKEKDVAKTRNIPFPSAAIMFWKNTPSSLGILSRVLREMSFDPLLEDQASIARIIRDPEYVTIVNNKRNVTNDPFQARLKFLPQKQYMNGHLFFIHPERVNLTLAERSEIKVVHANGLSNQESAIKSKKLWVLDKKGRCEKN